MWTVIVIVYLLTGLPFVTRCGPRWPLWLNLTIVTLFLPSFVIVVAASCFAGLFLDCGWSQRYP